MKVTIHRSEFSTSLLFHPLLASHTGNYTCQVQSTLYSKHLGFLPHTLKEKSRRKGGDPTLQATNSAGRDEVEGSLLVQAPPRWVREPKDAEVVNFILRLQKVEIFSRWWPGRR